MKSLKLAAVLSLASVPAMASENFSYTYLDVAASQAFYDKEAYGLVEDLEVKGAKAELSFEVDGVAFVASQKQIEAEDELAGLLLEGELSEAGIKFIHSSPDMKGLDLALQLSAQTGNLTQTTMGVPLELNTDGYSAKLGVRYIFSKKTDLELEYKAIQYKEDLLDDANEITATGRFYVFDNLSVSASYVHTDDELEVDKGRVEVGLRFSF